MSKFGIVKCELYYDVLNEKWFNFSVRSIINTKKFLSSKIVILFVFSYMKK